MDYVTVQQAASLLDKSEPWVRQHIGQMGASDKDKWIRKEGERKYMIALEYIESLPSYRDKVNDTDAAQVLINELKATIKKQEDTIKAQADANKAQADANRAKVMLDVLEKIERLELKGYSKEMIEKILLSDPRVSE